MRDRPGASHPGRLFAQLETDIVHAEAPRHQIDPHHRRGTDRHWPGLRIRLFRTQACKALKEEGYRVILVNSNPATIMTDPGLADATYVEPITPEVVAKIIARSGRMRCCRPWAARRR
ncbi:hypothetical protein AJ87_31690 [Rhizobium yanglingense]|nr:hypothetical protein AJ87_31690 [Rhizobium yanglingense]